jgi:hypothetical protein
MGLTGQGTFLALHLWSNAVLALIYHPDLLKSPSGIETPLNATMNRNVKLALASSRQICEAMVFADLVDSASYVRPRITVTRKLKPADDHSAPPRI